MLLRSRSLTRGVHLLRCMHARGRRLKQLVQLWRPAPHLARNLIGDRYIEWGWVSAHMPPGPGRALDFGTGEGFLSLVAAERGFEVLALDLSPQSWPFRHPRIEVRSGDVLEIDVSVGSLDLIINCSSVEHVGLAGRYGVVRDRPDGDLEAMRRMSSWLRPGGTMLLTVPVGVDEVFSPNCRVYGEQRLPLLTHGWSVAAERYWLKDELNRWAEVTAREALVAPASASSASPNENLYGLGCFALRRG